MAPLTTSVTHALGALTLFADALIGLFVIAAVVSLVDTPVRDHVRALLRHVGRHGAAYGFIVTAGATLGSLFYSSIADFPPCSLCWWQRIFMFPLPFLFAIHLARRDRTDRSIVYETFVLGGVGAAISLFHYLGQMFNGSVLPCPPSGVSCADRPFVEFGYITIPMMALSVFVLVGILMAARLVYLKSHAPR